MGIYVHNASVHIHFNVGKGHGTEAGNQTFQYRIHHFLSGEIQHQLRTGTNGGLSGNLQCIIRMGTIKSTVFIDHFRLNPNAEMHVLFFQSVSKAFQTHPQLFFIGHPVSQTGEIRISLSEPAVIHNQQIHAQGFSFSCQFNDFFSGKVKVAGLPGIQQNREIGQGRFRCNILLYHTLQLVA